MNAEMLVYFLDIKTATAQMQCHKFTTFIVFRY